MASFPAVSEPKMTTVPSHGPREIGGGRFRGRFANRVSRSKHARGFCFNRKRLLMRHSAGNPSLSEAVYRAMFELLESRRCLPHIVGSGTNYASIQAAVNAAAPGAIINVDAGTYSEQVTVRSNSPSAARWRASIRAGMLACMDRRRWKASAMAITQAQDERLRSSSKPMTSPSTASRSRATRGRG